MYKDLTPSETKRRVNMLKGSIRGIKSYISKTNTPKKFMTDKLYAYQQELHEIKQKNNFIYISDEYFK